jgi:thiol:disulfide interchange protein DsbD
VVDSRVTRLLVGLLALALLAGIGAARANPVTTENLTARLVAEREAAAPGQPVALALVFDIRPGWHTYWRNPGDSGESPAIRWELPPGVIAGPIRWPFPELIRVGPLANYGYSGTAVHLVDLEVPADWPVGRPLRLAAHASWLVCEEECIPESGVLGLEIPVAARPGAADPDLAGLFDGARQRVPQPSPAPANLSRAEDGRFRLAVDRAALSPDIRSAWYFPGSWGLIEHAAAQPLRLDASRLLLELAPGPLAASAESEGVLVIETGAGVEAFRLDPVRTPAQAGSAEDGPGAPLGLPLALGFALLGGLLLNLMPCVFPVLAMKAMSLAGHGGLDRRARALHGLAYTGGVLVFFALVAGLLLALRAAGTKIGWGYQLQYPPFVVGMAYLFFVLGLSLVGAVTLGSRLMGLGALGPATGNRGAFATGALAALVAAPCTAPFMGAALGYAVTLSWPLALSVMLALGVGLALPYLLLALVPGSARLLPSPGPWMESLKQFLAFPMFATAAWLVWVLSVQSGPPGVAAVLAGLVLIALGLWLWERSGPGRPAWRAAGRAAALGALGAGALLGLTLPAQESRPRDAPAAAAALSPVPFTAARLEQARGEGRPVLVNMTAAWCITCLVNERVALRSTAVAEAFAAAGVLYLKGDWTNRDPAITDYLARFGRNGVPLYVYYPVAGAPRVLPQVLTETLVLNALKADGVDPTR